VADGLPLDGAIAKALGGRYTLVRQLGRGGMGVVYLARDVKLGREVAIKVLPPLTRAALGSDRFQREVQLVSRLSHPHIVPLFEADESHGILFYVMEYVAGETLQQRLDREGPMALGEALRIAGEVGDALQYAHEQGTIHRDIKPANILLSGGHARVADFGIAKYILASDDAQTLTDTGVAIGTAPYMSPEQAAGDKRVDARTDIYGLAAVLYEMLVGEAPFTGSSVQAIVARVMVDPPRPVRTTRSNVPPHVERAILDGLAKLPADRPASAKEFLARLAGHKPAGSRYRVAAVVAGLAIAGLGGWAVWGALRPAPPSSMVLIPGGTFRLFGGGCSQCAPEQRVTLDSFYIDRTEVPVVAYAAYVAAGRAPAPWEVRPADSLPVTGVFWVEAAGYCRWRDPRAQLPSEEQWEAAARGGAGLLYPWGPVWEEGRANADNSRLGLLRVGASPEGATPAGVQDLIGNAWEWTASAIRSQPVIRGGAYNSPRTIATGVHRSALPAATAESLRLSNYGNTGFRCARPVR
jgi:formylglycine-generating enzyme required for sulfatase activity